MRKGKNRRPAPEWAHLLVEAVNTPGIISSAFSQFWNYSVGNQLLAIFECQRRGLQLGPINTFNGWLTVGRHVKKGERAITLCMPVTVKSKSRLRSKEVREPIVTLTDLEPKAPPEVTGQKTIFLYKARWFVLSQTEGKDYVPTETPKWSESVALRLLNIERITFDHPDGNCQGFARLRQVSVSPIAHLPHVTLFHELAHVVLGHTAEGPWNDHGRTPKNLREVEAECVALICCESLALPGIPECRGYVQYWLRGQTIPDTSAQRIFRAADAILRSGRPRPEDAVTDTNAGDVMGG